MDPITQQTTLAAAGGKKDPVYVDDVFNTDLWAGNETNRSITNGIDLTKGGMVWLKARTIGHDHLIFDTERGANYRLKPNTTDSSASATNRLTAFNNDGFTLGTDSDINQNNQNVVSWTFRKAPGFFDVVTYTGTGSARTLAHSLGSVPGMIMVKRTDATENWHVYHRSLGATKYLILDTNNTEATGSSIWNDTTPTSTNFTVGTNGAVNGSGGTYVAYIFAHDDAQFGTDEDESIIKCGSFSTNSNGVFTDVNLGFEPQWVLIKETNGPDSWWIYDTMRGLGPPESQQMGKGLQTNSSSIEASTTRLAINQNGLATYGNYHLSGNLTYIYMAIRRPNKPPEVGTDVFAINYGTSNTPNFTSGFPVDLGLWKQHGSSDAVKWGTRLTGDRYLKSSVSNAEADYSSIKWDMMNGWNAVAGTDYISHMFKRAPGFFDVVTYTGTGSATTINHNLTVEPELIMVKCRSHSENWGVYSSALGPTKYLRINTTAAANTSNIFWNDTAPTSSVFTVYPYDGVNGSGKTYLALLFATLPGISKVGSYSGTGSNINVDCGFTAGARFVLIKRSDSTGGWYVYDTTRGIVSGSDPYFELQDSSAQVTGTDYIDPLSTGFTITSATPPALNTNGGSYIFLAIA